MTEIWRHDKGYHNLKNKKNSIAPSVDAFMVNLSLQNNYSDTNYQTFAKLML